MTKWPTEQVSTVAGRQIHWVEQPGRNPVVVFLNGCGLSLAHWRSVADLLPGQHLVAYDRPGMGTPWPGKVPTLGDEIGTLSELVAEVGGPAVLVAHSMAAFHAEGLARLFPNLVAGLVMVDGSAEWLAEQPRPGGVRVARAVRKFTRVQPIDRVGSLVHRIGASTQSLRHNGKEWDERYAKFYREPDALAMGAAESSAYKEQAWDLLQLRSQPLPSVPAIVLTASAGSAAEDELARQNRWAKLLGARQIVVDGSHHLMMTDRPDAVADAIDAVLEEVV